MKALYKVDIMFSYICLPNLLILVKDSRVYFILTIGIFLPSTILTKEIYFANITEDYNKN